LGRRLTASGGNVGTDAAVPCGAVDGGNGAHAASKATTVKASHRANRSAGASVILALPF
jgi:hypothetical protein